MITDEEIEKAADSAMHKYEHSYGDEHPAWVEGAQWMRQFCGLQWKKRNDEETLREGEYIILVMHGSNPYCGWVADNKFICDGGDLILTKDRVAAYAYITLPELMEGKCRK